MCNSQLGKACTTLVTYTEPTSTNTAFSAVRVSQLVNAYILRTKSQGPYGKHTQTPKRQNL
jgi:hypothetical protein